VITPAILHQAGQVPYPEALTWQEQWVAERLHNPNLPDLLLLLEHPPVYTLGRGASLEFVRTLPEGVTLHRVGRGGEVTYHAPGQLVGYPILNLHRHQRDLHWYLRQLEQVLIDVIQQYGLPAQRKTGLTGVWIEGVKVAALGVQVKRWITCHGFALNICPDLAGFNAIVPCGIDQYPVGSLQQFLPHLDPETLQHQVQQQVIKSFAAIFQLQFGNTTALNAPGSFPCA
jgi:lipoyl(octanoyl) transferase